MLKSAIETRWLLLRDVMGTRGEPARAFHRAAILRTRDTSVLRAAHSSNLAYTLPGVGGPVPGRHI